MLLLAHHKKFYLRMMIRMLRAMWFKLTKKGQLSDQPTVNNFISKTNQINWNDFFIIYEAGEINVPKAASHSDASNIENIVVSQIKFQTFNSRLTRQ